MGDAPSKAAIERACGMQGYRADWYFKGGYYDEVQIAQIETVARHLDQASETAKAWKSAWDDGKLAPLAVRDMANALILPDPELDAETQFSALTDALCLNQQELEQIERTGAVDMQAVRRLIVANRKTMAAITKIEGDGV